MTTSFREKAWFVSSFLKKYSALIGISLIITVPLLIFGNSLIKKLPLPKDQVRVGIVGQFGSNQLPQTILNFLDAGLISLNEKYEPVPNVAQSWSISEDGKTHTFFLDQKRKWSDGKPIIASDIKMSIPNITFEALDPDTVKFHIPTKFSPFLGLLNIPLINQNAKIAGQYGIKLKQKGSGIITQITLESPKQNIIFSVFATAKLALTAFKLGQTDVVLDLPSELHSESVGFGKTDKKIDQDKVVMIIFNHTDPNLKDKFVKQGIAYMLKNKTFGENEALTTINPNSWSYNSIVKTYPFNPLRSKELVKSKISLELATRPELLKYAEEIKSQLDSELFEINIKVVTSAPEQFQLFLTTYQIPTDPDQYRDWHSTQSTNIGKGADEKIDKLLEDGRITYDQKARKGIYFDFQKTFSEELPALVLFHPSSFTLYRKDNLLEIFK